MQSVTTNEITKADKSQMVQEIVSYIGKKRAKELRNLSPKDQEILVGLGIKDIKGTYLVEGTDKDLSKFKNYFLSRCAISRPAYSQYMLSDYVESHRDKDEDSISRLETELLFIRCHREAVGIGNTENWMEGFVLNSICNRNRKGLVTVILTERELPLIQASKSEIKYIDLAKAFRTARVKTYIDNKTSNLKTEVTGGVEEYTIY